MGIAAKKEASELLNKIQALVLWAEREATTSSPQEGTAPNGRRRYIPGEKLRVCPSHEYARVVQPYPPELPQLRAADDVRRRGNRARRARPIRAHP